MTIICRDDAARTLSSWYRDLSLRTRILLLLLPTMLAVPVIVFERVADLLETELTTGAALRQTAAANHIAHQIDDAVRLRIAALNAIARELGDPRTGGRGAAALEPKMYPVAGVMFSQGLLLAGPASPLAANASKLTARREIPAGADEQRERLEDAADQEVGKPQRAPGTGKPVVALITARGRGSDRLLGLIGLDDQRVFSAVSDVELDASGYALVISPNERLIVAASDKGRVLQSLPAPGVDPLLDRRLAEGYEGVGVSSSWNGVESLTAASRVGSTGWVVVTGVGRAEVLASAVGLKRMAYFLGSAAAAGFVLVLHLVLRRELLPLTRATRSMAEMTGGSAAFAPVPEDGAGEIGRMIASFNSLAASRKLAEERLRLANARMEQRVEERTRQLTEANSALGKEVGRRAWAERQAQQFAARLKELTQRFVQVEEREKRRLARELHDRVSSSLMAVGLSLGLIARDLGREKPETLRVRLADAADLIKDTMVSAREISTDMHPASLDYGGLYGALDDYARKFSARTGLPVRLESNDTKLRLAPDKETALFRIVQEALMNSAKHARAKCLQVSLQVQVGRLVLTVADDGEGFDMKVQGKDSPPRSGLGLLSMGERAEAVAGKLQIESRRGQGTRVTVDMATSLI